MEQQVRLLGSQVHYWVYNPNKPKVIVMIHGFRGTHHGLLYIIEDLHDMQMIVPDLPGFGASSPLEGQHTIGAYRDFVVAFIKSLKLKEPPILLGHSFGAVVVAAVAASEPQLISQLILINPIAKSTNKAALNSLVAFFYWLGFQLPEPLSRGLLGNPLMVKFMDATLTKTRDPALRRRVSHNHATYFSTYHNRQTLHQAFRASSTHSATEYAPFITTPTLVVAGEKDIVAPLVTQRRLLNSLKFGTLVVLPNVGHLVHYEKPTEAAVAIRQFVKS